MKPVKEPEFFVITTLGKSKHLISLDGRASCGRRFSPVNSQSLYSIRVTFDDFADDGVCLKCRKEALSAYKDWADSLDDGVDEVGTYL